VVACYNLLLRALGGDGGSAPSRVRALVAVDGGPVPLGPTAAHEPTPIARGAWARWKSLGATSGGGKYEEKRLGTNGNPLSSHKV